MNFDCPYCSKPTTITTPNFFSEWRYIYVNSSTYGDAGLRFTAITCPNKECNKLYLNAKLTDAYKPYSSWNEGEEILETWNLLPDTLAKALPDYIPAAIKEDYYESCKIKNLSPKASATLARRCIQGMIRDFWGITKGTLNEEIIALEEKVDISTWESIDAVRSVGNIGAHMEKDINLIIDVDPEEAQLLISLIEQLIEDWYIQRHKREERAANLKQLAVDKKAAKGNAKEPQNKN